MTRLNPDKSAAFARSSSNVVSIQSSPGFERRRKTVARDRTAEVPPSRLESILSVVLAISVTIFLVIYLAVL
jgi:hypothetical protein